jgi:hypothetical protein
MADDDVYDFALEAELLIDIADAVDSVLHNPTDEERRSATRAAAAASAAAVAPRRGWSDEEAAALRDEAMASASAVTRAYANRHPRAASWQDD